MVTETLRTCGRVRLIVVFIVLFFPLIVVATLTVMVVCAALLLFFLSFHFVPLLMKMFCYSSGACPYVTSSVCPPSGRSPKH
jgi:hypothetical protein